MANKKNKKFNKKLREHKKKIAALGRELEEKGLESENQNDLFTIVTNQSKELCLVNSGFKCERCGNNTQLQIHHLIDRRSKKFMPFHKYITQRYYWANQIILCSQCHQKFHEEMGHTGGQEENLTLDKETINNIKEKYNFKK